MAIADFFRTGPLKPQLELSPEELKRQYSRNQWSVFLSAMFGYGFYYLARINLSVVKKPLIDEGIFSTTELGVIGSALLVVYAVGKFVNGFLADRANIGRFMGMSLFVIAIVNLVLGFTTMFWAFVILWGINGWFQSTGSAPSVVALSHWFSSKEIGTRYGVWSASHSIGEGLTFVLTSSLVSFLGWRWGFFGPSIACAIMGVLVLMFLKDRPESLGLPSVEVYRGGKRKPTQSAADTWAMQKRVLATPAIWIVGIASANMYVARYGINNWGILFLQEEKGYSLVEAGSVLGIYPLAGLVGGMASGIISDKLFNSRRNVPCLLYAIIELASLIGFWLIPGGHPVLDVVCLVGFGFSLGGLLVYLGGLMAVDFAPKGAAGAAMGIVGCFSYFGAAIQDTVSGMLLDSGKETLNGVTGYSFDGAFIFWISTSAFSLLLTLLIWNAGKEKDEAVPTT